MLHAILLILKILGIILLALLGLVLLILLSVLFIPITYKVSAEFKEKIHVSLVGGWLFRLLSVHFVVDGPEDWKTDLQIRILGIPVLKPFEEKKAKKPKKTRKPADRDPEKHSSGEENIPAGQPSLQEPAAVPELTAEHVQTEHAVRASDTVHQENATPKRKNFAERISGIFHRLVYAVRGFCDKIRHMWEAVKGIPDRFRMLSEKKAVYLEFWNREEHCRARYAVLDEARYLLKKIKPKKVEGYIRFGFEDPSATGMVLGGASILYAWYPKKFQLIPDFDRQVLEGELKIRGGLRLYAAALILCRLFFNKDVRQMYVNWQKM